MVQWFQLFEGQAGINRRLFYRNKTPWADLSTHESRGLEMYFFYPVSYNSFEISEIKCFLTIVREFVHILETKKHKWKRFSVLGSRMITLPNIIIYKIFIYVTAAKRDRKAKMFKKRHVNFWYFSENFQLPDRNSKNPLMR